MITAARWFYLDVPGIGNVNVSRHAQERSREEKITEPEFRKVLEKGRTIPDGLDVVWRELNGIRIVLQLRPTPYKGAALVVTVYRVEQAARVS